MNLLQIAQLYLNFEEQAAMLHTVDTLTTMIRLVDDRATSYYDLESENWNTGLTLTRHA